MNENVRKTSLPPPARREPRIQPLSELHLSYEGDSHEVPIRPPDLSLHGMFVNTTTHFPEGAVLNLRFRLTRSDVEVQTRGEVRYCLAGIGIGIEFVELGKAAAQAIERELKAYSRPRSARRRRKPRKAS